MIAIKTLREFTENIPLAWATGTNAKLINPIPNNQPLPNDEYFMFGILRGSGEIYKRCEHSNYNFYYADHPYFTNITNPKHSCYRITKNGHANPVIKNRPNDRYLKFKNEDIKNWDKSGKHILICPPSIFIQVFDQAFEWLSKTIEIIKKNSDRKIIINEKKQSLGISKKINLNLPPINEEYSNNSLNYDLLNAWCLVTYNSMASLSALTNGIPVFTNSNKCAAFNLSEHDFSKIENPIYPENRELLFNSLAYSQFTLDEMKSGYAYKISNENYH